MSMILFVTHNNKEKNGHNKPIMKGYAGSSIQIPVFIGNSVKEVGIEAYQSEAILRDGRVDKPSSIVIGNKYLLSTPHNRIFMIEEKYLNENVDQRGNQIYFLQNPRQQDVSSEVYQMIRGLYVAKGFVKEQEADEKISLIAGNNGLTAKILQKNQSDEGTIEENIRKLLFT